MNLDKYYFHAYNGDNYVNNRELAILCFLGGVMSEFKEEIEGEAHILLPNNNGVFFNPTQIFNRDTTLFVIVAYWKLIQEEKRRGLLRKDFPKKLLFFEGLAASGLRTIRYACEVPEEIPSEFVANDLSTDAYDLINKNIEHNKSRIKHSIRGNLGNAIHVMNHFSTLPNNERPAIIDLDPYGSPAMFLDCAIRAVCDGGLLCITCTDLLVLCGNQVDVCYRRYGGVPLKTPFCHEQAIRLCIHSIVSTGARAGRLCVPILSFFHAHYLRVYIRVFDCSAGVRSVVLRNGLLGQCVGCGCVYRQDLCAISDRKTKKERRDEKRIAREKRRKMNPKWKGESATSDVSAVKDSE
ncbi:tRNA methyltransferase, Trm1 like protein, partial [Aduncisulcus paluster]